MFGRWSEVSQYIEYHFKFSKRLVLVSALVHVEQEDVNVLSDVGEIAIPNKSLQECNNVILDLAQDGHQDFGHK